MILLDRQLIDYLPEVLKRVRELKAVVEAEQPEIINLWTALENALNDQFVSDATINGVKRYEKILKVTPKATENIEERKFRIITRLNEQLPYTITSLKHQLEALCGAEGDGFSIELNTSIYTLKVRIALASKNNYGEVESLLERIVPANIIIDVSLKYNPHSTFTTLTHGELTAYTHYDLRNEVFN